MRVSLTSPHIMPPAPSFKTTAYMALGIAAYVTFCAKFPVVMDEILKMRKKGPDDNH